MNFSQWNNEEEQFVSYFNTHYKPLLDKMADCPYSKIEFSDREKRLLGFLRDDLTKIFKEEEF